MNPEATDVVELTLPADPQFFRLARMTASGVAADFGASEDAVMELRLAVDEACAVLIEHADAETRLHVMCAMEDRDFVVTVTSSATNPSRLQPHPVAEAILAWAVSSYEIDRDADGHDVIRLIKPLEARREA